ncbi:copper chaperone [Rhodocytophaga aerolata]|uniref:Copper chaperone n=1 Tax=Rhodocytophaga aerolata TaxID=455078 RepID=A0ABT8R7T7_9BACT|nr:copper chaperone [Rhodocytophaga aerolata]MDO1448161.1 copper chaperone [Rhodocytophaga aerolata]
MEILKFKTTIQSDADLQKITPLLNKEESFHQWKLDTSTPENILNISTNDPDPQVVINLLKTAGFQAELIQVFGAGGAGL